MTNSRHAELGKWAKKHEMSLSEAADYLIDKGLEAENEPKATRADIERIITETQALKTQQEATGALIVQAINEQPVQVLEAPKKSIFDKFRRKNKSHE